MFDIQLTKNDIAQLALISIIITLFCLLVALSPGDRVSALEQENKELRERIFELRREAGNLQHCAPTYIWNAKAAEDPNDMIEPILEGHCITKLAEYVKELEASALTVEELVQGMYQQLNQDP